MSKIRNETHLYISSYYTQNEMSKSLSNLESGQPENRGKKDKCKY